MTSIRTLIAAAVLSASVLLFFGARGGYLSPAASPQIAAVEKESASPEPFSVGLMGIGLLGLGMARRRLR
jgi:hypothetical protein